MSRADGHLSVEVGEQPLLCLVDEVLHLGLQPPPLELDCHQLVGGHHWLTRLLKYFSEFLGKYFMITNLPVSL